MPTTSGKVASKRRDGKGIKVGDEWYNGSESMLSGVAWKGEVAFTYEKNGRNNTITSIDSFTAEGGGGTLSEAAAPAGGAKSNVQASIMYQNSRTAAVSVVSAAMTAGILPLPSTKDGKMDAFLAAVDQVTDRFFDDVSDVQDTGQPPLREEG